MSDEDKPNKLVFQFDTTSILEIVGKWFESKMIHYSDEMFSDYYEHVKGRLLTSESFNDYLLLRVNELIFKLLGDYHGKKKETYKDVAEEEDELVPQWFLTERYAEIQEMFSSKFFKHSFTEIDVEYDSALKIFSVTLHLEKEIDSTSYEILLNDVRSYLKNRITLLNFNHGKVLGPNILDITFGIDW
ncbi:MAG: hypothetical protein ACTSSN_10940 [Candidatus Heimdallarchaeaceae archaeon]